MIKDKIISTIYISFISFHFLKFNNNNNTLERPPWGEGRYGQGTEFKCADLSIWRNLTSGATQFILTNDNSFSGVAFQAIH